MKTIYLHGYLHDLHPDPIVVEAENVAEAIRSLSVIPELQPEEGQLHPIEVPGVDTEIALYASGGLQDIHVHPLRTGGGGKGGFMQIVLGVALIAISFALPAAGFGAMGFLSSSSVFMAGAMMALGGVLQLLAPTPGDSERDEEDSKYLPSSGNTVKIGTPIPILYGTSRAAGHYLTFDVDAKGVVGNAGLEGETTNAQGEVSPKPARGGENGLIFGYGPSWNARNGHQEYSSGTFSYTFYQNPPKGWLFDKALRDPISFPPQDPWKIFAKGFTDDLNPGALHDVLQADTPGYIAVYRANLTPTSTGEHEFSGAEKFTLKDSGGIEVFPTTAGFDLVAGETYEVSMWFSNSFEIKPTGANWFNRAPMAPTILYKQPGGSFQEFVFEPFGTSAPEEEEVVLQDSRYVRYDRTLLQDQLAVLRPIYSSDVPGPTNIPISDWSA